MSSKKSNKSDNTPFIARQGDVLMFKVDPSEVSEGENITPDNRTGRQTLAYGEVTGHAHAFDVGTKVKQKKSKESKQSIEETVLEIIGRPASLKHEEHTKIDLDPGKFIVRKQREYSSQQVRRVQD